MPPETEDDMNQVEILDHLSAIPEQYGVKFAYVTEGVPPNETVVALTISTTENPDCDAAIDSIIQSIGLLAEVGFEALSFFNREQPLIIRHQQLHTLLTFIAERVEARYKHAISRSAGQIEVVGANDIH